MIEVDKLRHLGEVLIQMHGEADEDHFNVVGSALFGGRVAKTADIAAAITELECLLESSDDDRDHRKQALRDLQELIAAPSESKT